MQHDEYLRELARYQTCSKDNLVDLVRWIRESAMPWLWQELGGILTSRGSTENRGSRRDVSPRRSTPMRPHDAVRAALATSGSEWQSLPSDPKFYRAQMSMFDQQIGQYCSAVDRFSKADSPLYAEATIDTLHTALMDNMRIVWILLEDAGREIVGVEGFFGGGRRQHEHPFEVFKATEQLLYGTFSWMTHADRAPYAGVAVLRTAIELRLRDAFCVNGYYDPANLDGMTPIDLSKVCEAVKLHQKAIDFDVDFHDVWKIYRWSNFYLHAGVRDFPWVAGFLVEYLRPLFAGPAPDARGNFNVNGGIRMNRATWHAVRAELEVGQAVYRLPRVDERHARCKFVD